MLAKLTSKNQLTLPKSALQQVGPVEYFEIEVLEGRLVLTPVKIQRADAVRAKLAALGLAERDVAGAVTWARQSSGRSAVEGRALTRAAAGARNGGSPVSARR
ncbi:MAG: AbrB/MazE/SpoVT family DNA-binding domain-containing protein [Steroidobacteraceae bacterium]